MSKRIKEEDKDIKVIHSIMLDEDMWDALKSKIDDTLDGYNNSEGSNKFEITLKQEVVNREKVSYSIFIESTVSDYEEGEI